MHQSATQPTVIETWDKRLLHGYFAVILAGIVITPLIFSLENQELFEFPKMLIVYVVSALATTLWLARMILKKSWILPASALNLPMLFFVFTQLLSTAFSIHPYTSIFGYYTRFHGGVISTVSYFLIYLSLAGNLSHLQNEFSIKAQKVVHFLLITLVSIGVIAALYAIPEKFGHSFSCIFASNEFTTECWKESTNPKYRIFGTFGQPNWLAAFLITLWPLTLLPIINFLHDKKTNRWFFLSILAAVIYLWAVWLTDSRSGILGLIGGFVALMFFLTLARANISSKLRKIAIVVVIAVSIAGGMLGWQWWQKSQDLQPAIGGSDSGAIRRVVWQGAYKVWQKYWLIGSGPETFAYSYYQFRPQTHNLLSEWDFLYNKAHNEWLNYLANTGILGFGTFVWFHLTAFYIGIKIITAKNKQPQAQTHKYLVAAILAGIISLQISNFFGFSTVAVTLVEFVLLGLLVWLEHQSAKPASPLPITTQINNKHSGLGLNLKQKIALILLVVICGLICRAIWSIWRADLEYTRGIDLLTQGYLEQGSTQLINAINRRPQEALFYDGLAEQYSIYTQSLLEQNDEQAARELANGALATSEMSLKLNPRHLNFYKTRIRVLSRVSTLNSDALTQALKYAQTAHELAPTDARLLYNQAKIELFLGQSEAAVANLINALILKPNYPDPRFDLADWYFNHDQLDLARDQYQYILDNLNAEDATSLERLEEITAKTSGL